MRALAAAFLFLASLPITAWAEDAGATAAERRQRGIETAPPLPPGDGWRRTSNFGVDSSDCIGNPKTPECVIDTLMACVGTGKYDLCRIAFARKLSDATDFTKHDPFIYDYRIASLTPFKKSDLPKRFHKRWWKPMSGDLLAIIQTRDCTYNPEPWQKNVWLCYGPDDLSKERQYLHLRRKDEHWFVKDEEPWDRADENEDPG